MHQSTQQKHTQSLYKHRTFNVVNQIISEAVQRVRGHHVLFMTK